VLVRTLKKKNRRRIIHRKRRKRSKNRRRGIMKGVWRNWRKREHGKDEKNKRKRTVTKGKGLEQKRTRSSGKNESPTTRATLKTTCPTILLLLRVYWLPR
jgi:hypothetical protein